MIIRIGGDTFKISKEDGGGFIVDDLSGNAFSHDTFKTAGQALDWLVEFVENHSEDV